MLELRQNETVRKVEWKYHRNSNALARSITYSIVQLTTVRLNIKILYSIILYV